MQQLCLSDNSATRQPQSNGVGPSRRPSSPSTRSIRSEKSWTRIRLD